MWIALYYWSTSSLPSFPSLSLEELYSFSIGVNRKTWLVEIKGMIGMNLVDRLHYYIQSWIIELVFRWSLVVSSSSIRTRASGLTWPNLSLRYRTHPPPLPLSSYSNLNILIADWRSEWHREADRFSVSDNFYMLHCCSRSSSCLSSSIDQSNHSSILINWITSLMYTIWHLATIPWSSLWDMYYIRV